jgi:hypothetical protein
LRESGWFFQPVQVQSELELLTGWRTWPDGWSDALAIRDLRNARAFGCDPAGGEVWKHEGLRREVLWLGWRWETFAADLVAAGRWS